MPLPLSVFIIAKNEADRLPVTIASLQGWVDEIIVVDSGSDDDTVAIADAMGARTVFNAWEGFGQQKKFAENQCRNDWVVNIDADEEVTPALRAGIEALFATSEPAHAAYAIKVLPLYQYQKSGHRWHSWQRPLRLYDRRRAEYRAHAIHDSVVVKTGTTGILDGYLIHRTFRSLSHHLAKIDFYSDSQAEDMLAKGRRISTVRLFFMPLLAFLKFFVLRRAFVNGVDGVITSHMYAFSQFIKLAKAHERASLNKRQSPDSHKPK